MQIQVARSSLFTAQAVARDMIAAGREIEIEAIRSYISSIIPDIRYESSAAKEQDAETAALGDENL